MAFFVGTAFNFFLATDTPERLPFKVLTEIGMRCAAYELRLNVRIQRGKNFGSNDRLTCPVCGSSI